MKTLLDEKLPRRFFDATLLFFKHLGLSLGMNPPKKTNARIL